MKIIHEQHAEILYNQSLSPGYYHIGIRSKRIVLLARPGQFLQVKCGPDLEPLLRRPVSIHRVRPESGAIEFIYNVLGKGTQLLSRKEAGDTLDVVGPLGNSFSVGLRAKNIVLVAGGLGVAPLLFWAQCLEKHSGRGKDGRKRQIYVIIGAAGRKVVLCENDFKLFSPEVRVATEDGSYGLKGTAAALFFDLLQTLSGRETAVYACGPGPMLKRIFELSQEYNLSKCQVSLEGYMACGIGACRGCAVKVRTARRPGEQVEDFEYKMVCSDGPVFEAENMYW